MHVFMQHLSTEFTERTIDIRTDGGYARVRELGSIDFVF